MKPLFVYFMLTMALVCRADKDEANPVAEVTITKFSPGQTCYIEYQRHQNDVTQIWVVSARDPSERALLYTFDRGAEVEFSDGEEWLVVNDFLGSNSTEPHIFHRVSGVRYQDVGNVATSAWAFVAKQVGLPEPPLLDHNYAEGLRWVDGHTLVILLHGHTDDRHYVTSWICLFDANTREFSTDANRFNSDSYECERSIERANKSVEVTPTAVTPAADAPGEPSAGAPHH
jgi:hypothetical protein